MAEWIQQWPSYLVWLYLCVPVIGTNSTANLFRLVYIQKYHEENMGEPAVLVNLHNTVRRPGVPTAMGGFKIPTTAVWMFLKQCQNSCEKWWWFAGTDCEFQTKLGYYTGKETVNGLGSWLAFASQDVFSTKYFTSPSPRSPSERVGQDSWLQWGVAGSEVSLPPPSSSYQKQDEGRVI